MDYPWAISEAPGGHLVPRRLDDSQQPGRSALEVGTGEFLHLTPEDRGGLFGSFLFLVPAQGALRGSPKVAHDLLAGGVGRRAASGRVRVDRGGIVDLLAGGLLGEGLSQAPVACHRHPGDRRPASPRDGDRLLLFSGRGPQARQVGSRGHPAAELVGGIPRRTHGRRCVRLRSTAVPDPPPGDVVQLKHHPAIGGHLVSDGRSDHRRDWDRSAGGPPSAPAHRRRPSTAGSRHRYPGCGSVSTHTGVR